MLRLIFFILIALAGFWSGKSGRPLETVSLLHRFHPEKPFPITEHKSFVILLYAHNQELWCERALRSIFEQEYDHYRVVFIDDGSIDQTERKGREFVLENNQNGKVLFLRNPTYLGAALSFDRAAEHCLDREILIPLECKDWLASKEVLARLNKAYQNPDVWLALGESIEYPSYILSDRGQISYYAFLFKQCRLNSPQKGGGSNLEPEEFIEAAGGRSLFMKGTVSFSNLVCH